MNDKEMNAAILAELYKIAGRVFDEGVNAAPGAYTARELAKMGKAAFASGYIKEAKREILIGRNYDGSPQLATREYNAGPVASIEVGGFSATFCVAKVFGLVARFERLAGAKTRRWAKYAQSGETVGKAEIIINKDMGHIANVCDKSGLRPAMGCVFIDTSNGYAVACDGHVLVSVPAEISKAEGTPDGVMLAAKDFKRLCAAAKKGSKLTVSIAPDGKQYAECAGQRAVLSPEGWAAKYPNYKSIYPKSVIRKFRFLFAMDILYFRQKLSSKALRLNCGELIILHFV